MDKVSTSKRMDASVETKTSHDEVIRPTTANEEESPDERLNFQTIMAFIVSSHL